jgi:hypothetical protein
MKKSFTLIFIILFSLVKSFAFFSNDKNTNPNFHNLSNSDITISSSDSCKKPKIDSIAFVTNTAFGDISVAFTLEEFGEYDYYIKKGTDSLFYQFMFLHPIQIITLCNLDKCKNYEIKIIRRCNDSFSEPLIYAFKTPGCSICFPFEISASRIEQDNINWQLKDTGTYKVLYGKTLNSVENSYNFIGKNVKISNLDACTDYFLHS